MLQAEPGLFQQYHQGFREQTRGWPKQPVDMAIAWLAAKPDSLVVADFGCGDAKIAASVKQVGSGGGVVGVGVGVVCLLGRCVHEAADGAALAVRAARLPDFRYAT